MRPSNQGPRTLVCAREGPDLEPTPRRRGIDMADLSPQDSFDRLKKNVVDSISSHFPFEGRQRKLELHKVWVDDKLDLHDLKSQTAARVNGTTWGVPVKGEVSLIDKKTGKVVERKTVTLARLPKMTPRYGYIVDGNEYQVDHLFRLRSGVYARVQNNGDLESEFNLAKGGPIGNFSIHIDRNSKRISLLKDNAHIPLYPILKAAGVADDQIEKDWGKEIFRANLPKSQDHLENDLRKFYSKTAKDGGKEPKDIAGLVKHVHDVFDQTKLLPETTKLTLGKEYHKVGGDVLHAASAKLLGVVAGTHKPDDRDSLPFKEVASAEDFIPEKIQASTKAIKARLLQTVDFKPGLKEIVPPTLFGDPVKDFFTKGSSIVERSDQTNPIQMLSAHRKTTLMAPNYGGIKNEHALTNELRGINPSHIGFLDPMKTPESERTGVSVNLSLQARKRGKEIEVPAYSLKTKKNEFLKAADFHHTAAVLPDQVRWVKGVPTPVAPQVKMKMPGGEIEVRPFKDATHVMPSAKGMFDITSNLIPFLPCDQGNRVSFADKQQEQAISLVHREAPLVQAKSDHPDPTKTFDKIMGEMSSSRSPVNGTVVSVKGDEVVVSDGKKKHTVHLYEHFPLNDNKAMLHSHPIVKVGDKVSAGQHLADTNYTKNGTLAVGSNLRVGYMPYKGYNFEDGIVISETAAKKLTSDHLHRKEVEFDPDKDHISKAKFLAHSSRKASEMSKEQLDALDDHGVIRVGSVVKPGQVLVAAIGENAAQQGGMIGKSYGARAFSKFKDKSLVWDEDHVGTVVRVVKDPNGKGVKVHVKTQEQMVVGDKISGRHGNKGIVTQILPDNEMPFTTDPKTGEKKPLEVVLNPSGVPTRINVGQILETAAAKIAEKTGKPYVVDNFAGPNHDYRKQVEEDLKKHGISDEEHVFDPNDPKKALGSVLVGPQYLMKLKHQVDKKLSVRGAGRSVDGKSYSYDAELQPSQGGYHGAQGFGGLELYSLLAHGARHNLREMATYKSDKQDGEFWSRIQSGYEPPTPQVPFSYKKFVGLLNGLGVDVQKNGSQVQLLPMTDKKIVEMAGGHAGEIKNPHLTVRAKDLKPEKGGLFDQDITGGNGGQKWGFIKLHEPMANPLFMGTKQKPGPIPSLLGLRYEDAEAICSGKQTLNGMTGGKAIQEALKKVHVDNEMEATKKRLPGLKGTALDRENRKLSFLAALKQANVVPHEAYVFQHVPVVPPMFRPMTPTPKGDLVNSPLIGLYKNIGIINNRMKEFNPSIHPEEMRAPIRADLWESLKALQSVGGTIGYDVDSPGGRKKLKGILNIIGGESGEDQPKEGFFQSRLIKKRQDLSIRSTIVPEPKLGIDEVGLPKAAAMELYKPFVVAEMVKRSFNPLDAQTEIKRGSPVAYQALEKVVAERPLLLKRDPVLHKFGTMAFKPVLHGGKAIQIHPLVTGGFNADFDGDTMAGTVPVSKEAVAEAHQMLPSKNLFSPTHFGVMYKPNQEMMLGLHLLTRWGDKSGKKFKDPIALNKAYDAGQVKHDEVVQVGGKETTFGRLLVNSRLPKGFGDSHDILHNPGYVIDKGKMGKIAESLARKHETEFGKSINGLKDLGNDYAFKTGFSFGLKDFQVIPERDQILKEADKEAARIKATIKDKDKLYEALVGEKGVYTLATQKIDAAAKAHHAKTGGQNRLMTMVYSGARGSPEQLRQMIAAPMLMQDSTNKTVILPVRKSYSEGLDIGDYWTSQHGARKGTLQRAQGTSLPGTLTKDIINTTMSTLITNHDCGTKEGVLMDISDVTKKNSDVHDRFLATAYKTRSGNLPAGTLVTPEVLTKLRAAKVDKVMVRSPLRCGQHDGLCSKCFGLNEAGSLHDHGVNIGVLAGQALGEPATQMAMDAFHTGGVAGGRGAGSVDRFTRLRNLLDVPKKLKNQATLARTSGKITQIREVQGTGDKEIFIDGKRHLVPREIAVDHWKPGMEVKKGQNLSHPDAPINPQHLLETTKDIHAVQNYLTGEMQKAYEKEGVRRRNIEVAVRSFTNLTKVVDPGDASFVHGDLVAKPVVEKINRELKPGQKPMHVEPVLMGIKQVTLTGSKDWLARLNYQGLHGTVIQGAAQGWKSDIHGTHPIPGLAMGHEFGKPLPSGKPKHHY